MVAPKQFPPDVLLVRMLLVTVSILDSLKMAPPPSVALLPEKVLLVTLAVLPVALKTATAPAPTAALLPEKVLLLTVRMPVLPMAPSSAAKLPLKLLSITARLPPLLKMAPPFP